MDWERLYAEKCTTAEDAVKRIKPGDRVVVGHACGAPEVLLQTLLDRKESYHDLEIVHMVPIGPTLYCLPENAPYFTHNSLFAGAASRDAINTGRAAFTPVHFSRIPQLFISGALPVDVTLCMISPPDEQGYCSFGISVDYTKPAAEHSRMVIAEVTPHMPRTLGDAFIHVSELDCIVPCDSKPAESPSKAVTPEDRKIGEYCAELVEDGACLQVGFGAVPDATLACLVDKKDLGIHTEMFSEGVVDLVERGVVTNERKNLHHGKMIATFLMGTRRLYDFAHNNPMVEMHPVHYTNNPAVIARNDNMVSINSALQVDLHGQVVADTIGYRQYAGPGGQVDFVRGSEWSRNGRSIIAMPATAAHGTISRIVPCIDEGACVCTTRMDAQYIVTEYGIANLWGKSLPQRARALTAIAHPDFREELEKEIARRGFG